MSANVMRAVWGMRLHANDANHGNGPETCSDQRHVYLGGTVPKHAEFMVEIKSRIRFTRDSLKINSK